LIAADDLATATVREPLLSVFKRSPRKALAEEDPHRPAISVRTLQETPLLVGWSVEAFNVLIR